MYQLKPDPVRSITISNAPRENRGADASAEGEELVTDNASVAVEEAAEAVDQEAIPYQLVEKKPTFNGGDCNEFSHWVNSQMKYPEKAKKEGAQGRVTLRFTIGADGVLRDAEVLKGASEELDAEALRVVSSSPKWEPGIQNGEAVPVTFVFPIIFKLK